MTGSLLSELNPVHRGWAGADRWVAFIAVCLAGCFSPIAPARPSELSGCHPGAYASPSSLACERDADCLLCGPGCGTLRTRAEVELTGEACPPIDYDACGGQTSACCSGRCVRSLGPPPL